jgi:ectoine hydroxylase-related dioxygenase (phytanoyl-CoA dioxygenase family)
MIRLHCRRDADWLEGVLAAIQLEGCSHIRGGMYRARDAIHAEVGEARLRAAGELGVLRIMGKFEPSLLRLLEIPELLAIVDATVSPNAILHLQNGFILPSFAEQRAPTVFQNSFHRDFPRHLNGYFASVNVLVAVDEFSQHNGATFVVPGSHQRADPPPAAHLLRGQVAADCEAGSLLVFDSTLWHAAGANTSGRDRLAINHQFTCSWIKQQIDYVRALGEEAVLRLPARTQQLLGYYTRVVTSLDEYYRPEAERLYRKGQG